MRTHYFEFDQNIVDMGKMPSTLCMVYGRDHDAGMFRVLSLAERVYYIDGNIAYEIKNRHKSPSKYFITNEEKVILRLKAVAL
jgi:hypothetical protein